MQARGSVSALLVMPLAGALSSSPEALAEFLAATDLTPDALGDPEARVSPAQFSAAWREAIRLSENPALPLSIVESLKPGSFGVVEYVCRSAATVRDALTLWCRYLSILDDAVEVGLVDVGRHTAVRVVTESTVPAPASHELCFALLVRNARDLLGAAFHVAEVRFAHRAGDAQAARYRAFFRAPVRFGAKYTEVLLERDVLRTPLPTADPNLHAILLPAAEEKRSAKSKVFPFIEQVRRALRSAFPNDGAQLESIAKRFGMTGRSLQRRLTEEGTSFQAMRDEVRRELADRYVREGMTFAETSFLLGFSQPSAFFRAFKRWTGVTPFERRAALSAAPPR